MKKIKMPDWKRDYDIAKYTGQEFGLLMAKAEALHALLNIDKKLEETKKKLAQLR